MISNEALQIIQISLKRKHSPGKCVIRATEIRRLKFRINWLCKHVVKILTNSCTELKAHFKVWDNFS